MPIPPGATEIHNISDAMVRKAPLFAQMWAAFLQWVETRRKSDQEVIMIAHNNFGYDLAGAVAVARAGRVLQCGFLTRVLNSCAVGVAPMWRADSWRVEAIRHPELGVCATRKWPEAH
jgi:DNA polymerase III epsilon subunit-like protein